MALNPLHNSRKGFTIDPAKSFKPHDKTSKHLLIVTFFSLLLLIGTVAGIPVHKRNSGNGVPSSSVSPSESIKAVCKETPYPDACFSSISALGPPNNINPKVIFKLSLQVAVAELSKLTSLPDRLAAKSTDPRTRKALTVCKTVLEDAVVYVNDSISSTEAGKSGEILSAANSEDVWTWLSAASENHETCLDALREIKSSLVDDAAAAMRNSSECTSNSLAIVTNISGTGEDFVKV
ncbi:pectinesterase 3-like [Malania oleifera]|uniref:pectinesterase 3-like n=1 Tax=Malania oleifera TaxID=397392 RepID=UPI0025AEC1EA|nr:pectinesterase 3-like [Malania oleifera]